MSANIESVVASVRPREGRVLTFSAIAQQLRYLEGKVLTTIDAAFSDPIQRKAVKDLVRLHFAYEDKYIENLCFNGLEQDAKTLKEGEHVIVIDSGTPPT